MSVLKANPVVAAVTMGYGHLRAAYPLAEAFGVQVVTVDDAPLAENSEIQLWNWVRRMHETLSRPLPVLRAFDAPARALMDAATMIPSLHEPRDHRAPTWSVRLLDHLVRRGLGRGMVEHLRETGAPLVTTFYAPAIIADRAGIDEVYCVVTDADCNRVWAPLDAASTRIRYLAPSRRVVRRLLSFGVPQTNIELTGFPLPMALTNAPEGPSLRQLVARRIAKLDTKHVFRDLHQEELGLSFPGEWNRQTTGPISLLFAVGGAGAQVGIAADFLPSLRPKIVKGELRVHLVAGTRDDVCDQFRSIVRRLGFDAQVADSSESEYSAVNIHFAPTFPEYYAKLNQVLLDADVLWTKPSEMSFYAALGLPCIVAPPVGAHERYNRRWLREQGVGLKQRRPDYALGWLEEWLDDGTLAAAAWSGFMRLPRRGTERIVRAVAATAGVPGDSAGSTTGEEGR